MTAGPPGRANAHPRRRISAATTPKRSPRWCSCRCRTSGSPRRSTSVTITPPPRFDLHRYQEASTYVRSRIEELFTRNGVPYGYSEDEAG